MMHFGLMLMFATATDHFVPKSFRTQVIKYFLVISYRLLIIHFVPMSFRYHFGGLIRTWLQNVKSGYEMTIV